MPRGAGGGSGAATYQTQSTGSNCSEQSKSNGNERRSLAETIEGGDDVAKAEEIRLNGRRSGRGRQWSVCARAENDAAQDAKEFAVDDVPRRRARQSAGLPDLPNAI
jgi:hypothetical protein